MLLAEELKSISENVKKRKEEWTEENWNKSHLNMIVGRLKLQADEGWRVCYFPHLTEFEEGYLSNQGFNVTKKEKTCDCIMSNGWFVDWFEEGELEEHQKDVEELYEEGD